MSLTTPATPVRNLMLLSFLTMIPGCAVEPPAPPAAVVIDRAPARCPEIPDKMRRAFTGGPPSLAGPLKVDDLKKAIDDRDVMISTTKATGRVLLGEMDKCRGAAPPATS